MNQNDRIKVEEELYVNEATLELLSKRIEGDVKKGFSLPVLATLVVSVFLVIALYAWGRGENVFSFYLEMYREIFGPGIGVKPL